MAFTERVVHIDNVTGRLKELTFDIYSEALFDSDCDLLFDKDENGNILPLEECDDG